MKKYICTVEVEAEPMTKAKAEEQAEQLFDEFDNPNHEGYLCYSATGTRSLTKRLLKRCSLVLKLLLTVWKSNGKDLMSVLTSSLNLFIHQNAEILKILLAVYLKHNIVKWLSIVKFYGKGYYYPSQKTNY